MKSVFTLIITIVIPFFALCQENFNFQFNANGEFKDSISEKNFVIIELPEMTAEDIYNNLLTSINIHNNNNGTYGLTNQIEKVENSVISLNTTIVDAYSEGMLGLPVRCSLGVSYKFQIKDGKLRIDAPVVHNIIKGNPNPNATGSGVIRSTISFKSEISGYFDKKGLLKKNKIKMRNRIDNAINKSLIAIIQPLFKPTNLNVDEDW